MNNHPFPSEREQTEEARRLQEYSTRIREQYKQIAPYLAALDMEALRAIEQAFQNEMHNALYGLKLEDQGNIAEVLAWVKGARSFLTWIENRRRLGG